MRNEYKPNPVIVDRAVALWKRALAAPLYQNERPGEGNFQNTMGMAMAGMLPKNNTPDILDKFAEALREILMHPQEYKHSPGHFHHVNYLRVDYHPDQELAKAAESAGLKMEFPYKTTMYIEEDVVSFALGYGSPLMNHYPLPDGRWLMTDLRGADMAKIIASINSGNDLGFEIEAAA